MFYALDSCYRYVLVILIVQVRKSQSGPQWKIHVVLFTRTEIKMPIAENMKINWPAIAGTTVPVVGGLFSGMVVRKNIQPWYEVITSHNFVIRIIKEKFLQNSL